jgi:hypothetical protein
VFSSPGDVTSRLKLERRQKKTPSARASAHKPTGTIPISRNRLGLWGLGTDAGHVKHLLYDITCGLGSTTLLVVVQDAPLVDVGIDLTVDEGSSLLLAFGFIDSASETHDATVVWGDGASTTGTVNQSLDTVSASHIYVDQGVFVVQASVSDDTGLSGLDTLSVTVANVAPVVIAATGLVRPDLPTPAFTLATFTDPGASDTHTAVIDWGDGTLEPGTVSDGSVSGAHLLVGRGAHLVTVTVTDSDGASTSAVAQVTVFHAPPVPGITGWGMVLSTALLAMVYLWAVRRRSAVQARPN